MLRARGKHQDRILRLVVLAGMRRLHRGRRPRAHLAPRSPARASADAGVQVDGCRGRGRVHLSPPAIGATFDRVGRRSLAVTASPPGQPHRAVRPRRIRRPLPSGSLDLDTRGSRSGRPGPPPGRCEKYRSGSVRSYYLSLRVPPEPHGRRVALSDTPDDVPAFGGAAPGPLAQQVSDGGMPCVTGSTRLQSARQN